MDVEGVKVSMDASSIRPHSDTVSSGARVLVTTCFPNNRFPAESVEEKAGTGTQGFNHDPSDLEGSLGRHDGCAERAADDAVHRNANASSSPALLSQLNLSLSSSISLHASGGPTHPSNGLDPLGHGSSELQGKNTLDHSTGSGTPELQYAGATDCSVARAPEAGSECDGRPKGAAFSSPSQPSTVKPALDVLVHGAIDGGADGRGDGANTGRGADGRGDGANTGRGSSSSDSKASSMHSGSTALSGIGSTRLRCGNPSLHSSQLSVDKSSYDHKQDASHRSKEREDKVKKSKERISQEKQRRIEELLEAQRHAQSLRQQQQEVRRVKIEEMKARDAQRQMVAEERRLRREKEEAERMKDARIRKANKLMVTSAPSPSAASLKSKGQGRKESYGFGSSSPRFEEFLLMSGGPQRAQSVLSVRRSESTGDCPTEGNAASAGGNGSSSSAWNLSSEGEPNSTNQPLSPAPSPRLAKHMSMSTTNLLIVTRKTSGAEGGKRRGMDLKKNLSSDILQSVNRLALPRGSPVTPPNASHTSHTVRRPHSAHLPRSKQDSLSSSHQPAPDPNHKGHLPSSGQTPPARQSTSTSMKAHTRIKPLPESVARAVHRLVTSAPSRTTKASKRNPAPSASKARGVEQSGPPATEVNKDSAAGRKLAEDTHLSSRISESVQRLCAPKGTTMVVSSPVASTSGVVSPPAASLRNLSVEAPKASPFSSTPSSTLGSTPKGKGKVRSTTGVSKKVAPATTTTKAPKADVCASETPTTAHESTRDCQQRAGAAKQVPEHALEHSPLASSDSSTERTQTTARVGQPPTQLLHDSPIELNATNIQPEQPPVDHIHSLVPGPVSSHQGDNLEIGVTPTCHVMSTDHSTVVNELFQYEGTLGGQNQSDGMAGNEPVCAPIRSGETAGNGSPPKNKGKGAEKLEEYKAKLAENRRLAREKAEAEAKQERERQEKLERQAKDQALREEENQRLMEQEELQLAELARRAERERLTLAIQAEEERKCREAEKAEAERIAREEEEARLAAEAALRKRQLDEQLEREQQERSERKRKLEIIMKRVKDNSSPTIETPNATDVASAVVDFSQEFPVECGLASNGAAKSFSPCSSLSASTLGKDVDDGMGSSSSSSLAAGSGGGGSGSKVFRNPLLQSLMAKRSSQVDATIPCAKTGNSSEEGLQKPESSAGLEAVPSHISNGAEHGSLVPSTSAPGLIPLSRNSNTSEVQIEGDSLTGWQADNDPSRPPQDIQ